MMHNTAMRNALALTVASLLVAGCQQPSQQAAKAQQPPPPQVTVSQPVSKVVAEETEVVGRFVAVDSVEVRARVSGYLEKVEFRDGQMVDKGNLLFTIDQRPFEATLAQAKAQLEQSKANLSFAEGNLERGENLRRGTVISEQGLDQRIQAERVARSAVKAQEAAVLQAELDLRYTELRAPVKGRIGDRRVSPGNLVTGGSGGSTTLLATIQSVDPIRFEFTLDEGTYLEFLKLHGEKALNDPSVPVRLKLISDNGFDRTGRVDFIDNSLSRTAGVIRMRAEFPNPDGLLTPGMFGRIRLDLAPPAEALLVPDEAVGTEQASKFVLVVDDKKIAKPKYVTLGPLVDGLRVVKGVDRSDWVIIKGLMRARPGSPVTPTEGSLKTAANDPPPPPRN